MNVPYQTYMSFAKNQKEKHILLYFEIEYIFKVKYTTINQYLLMNKIIYFKSKSKYKKLMYFNIFEFIYYYTNNNFLYQLTKI